MAQWPVCSVQNTDTDVKACSDGSGCENQGSCARQGATMDTGDNGCGKERTAVAKAAVTQGSCVVCAQLVRTGYSGWKGLATVAVNRRQGRLCWSYGGSDQECAGRGSNSGAGGGSGHGRGFAMGGRYEVT